MTDLEIIVKGSPKSGKTLMMLVLCKMLNEQGLEVEMENPELGPVRCFEIGIMQIKDILYDLIDEIGPIKLRTEQTPRNENTSVKSPSSKGKRKR